MNIGNIFRNLPQVTLNLLIINVLIFIIMTLFPSLGAKIDHYGALHYFTSPAFNPAQLLTYMFIHANFTHLFFNMFALVMFGGVIERSLGSSRFLFYYISCGLGAALIQMGIFAILIGNATSGMTENQIQYSIIEGYKSLTTHTEFYGTSTMVKLALLVNTPMVGASGAIYGILLAFGMLYPNQPLYMFFIPVPIKAKWIVIGYVVLELALGIGELANPNMFAGNVAHFAHLGGMLIGIIMILYWKKKGDFRNRWFF